jgi:integrase
LDAERCTSAAPLHQLGAISMATAGQKINFTKKALQELKPKTKRFYAYDLGCPGLALCVTPRGQRTFYFCRRVHGAYERNRIGLFPQLSVDQARTAAIDLAGQVARGQHPQAERKAKRTEMTLLELFNFYLELHAKPHKKSWKRDDSRFHRYLWKWRGRRLSTITKREVLELRAEVESSVGRYAGNQVVELIRHMYVMAPEYGWEGKSPAAGIKRLPVTARERFLSADELPRFFTALEAVSRTTTRDFLKICLFTGARRSNCEAMAWEDLDLPAAVWTVPSVQSKNKRTLRIHLAPQALEILERRKAECGNCPWVFPTESKSATGHLVDTKHAWREILKKAGLEDLRLHDLRRTFGSFQASGGSSLHVIGASLGHASTAATGIYARLVPEAVSGSVNAAVSAITTAGKKAVVTDAVDDAAEG